MATVDVHGFSSALSCAGGVTRACALCTACLGAAPRVPGTSMLIVYHLHFTSDQGDRNTLPSWPRYDLDTYLVFTVQFHLSNVSPARCPLTLSSLHAAN